MLGEKRTEALESLKFMFRERDGLIRDAKSRVKKKTRIQLKFTVHQNAISISKYQETMNVGQLTVVRIFITFLF